MKTGISRRRAPWALLWGALVILGWAVLSSLLGGGTAHAADAPDDAPSSLLSKLSSQVKATTTAVSDLIDDAVQPVADKATDAVQTVAETVTSPVEKAVAVVPAPVRAPVTEAVTASREVVTTAVEPVVAVVRDAPVARVLKPVTDAVAELPVVGEVIDSLGVPEFIERTGDTVDDVLDIADPVVAVVLPPAVDPGQPGSHVGQPGAVTDAASTAPEFAPTNAAADRDAFPLSALVTGWHGITPDRDGVPVTPSVAARDESPASSPPGAPEDPASPTTSAGPSGSSSGVPANADESSDLHPDSWTANGTCSNTVLPPSPAGSTDVSPD